jgi:oxygen-dependent protoporphyrinogen oxidase
VESVALRGAALGVVLRDGGEQEFDALVVATEAASAARLLGDAVEPARSLALSGTSSSVSVSLAYARSALDHALDATGFVVAEGEQREGFRACTFASSKFAGRAPAQHALVRLFFRPEGNDLAASDADWAARAERALARALPVRAPALRAWVSRWPNALPVFDAEHTARVREFEAALAGKRVLLAGSAFHGSGIDAAVRSAESAAAALND